MDEAFEDLCKNRFELDPSAVKAELARIRIKYSASGRDQKALQVQEQLAAVLPRA